ncbi:MAG: hypothetical protein GY817_07240 [bacterium]|nr:hypothetical protein [bacterium]
MFNLDYTKKFYETLKELTFWQRLFSWSKITALLPDSYAEVLVLETLKNEHFKLTTNLKLQEQKLLSNTASSYEVKLELQALQSKNLNLEKQLSKFEQEKEERQIKYDERFERLISMEEELTNRRIKLEDDEKAKISEVFEKMKKTWQNHEVDVEEEVKRVAGKYVIEYFDKESLPFPRVKPDNTLYIANEYVIFDAKSPNNDDFKNFPNYLKKQVEQAKKYAKLEGVKKDLFLVVPTNTIDKIDKTFFNLSDYSVFIITKDSLEPVILCLQKIEDYEFAEKLAPEDRDSICRIIGRFAHTTKRRLQIDNFFAREFIRLWQDSEVLPQDMLVKAMDYEKGYKLNPDQEKRAKQIDVKKLIEDTNKIEKEFDLEK